MGIFLEFSQVAHATHDFSITMQREISLLSFEYWYSDLYKILHMPRQLGCRGMLKNL